MSDDPRMPAWVAEARRRASELAHPWDVAALDWPLTPESVVVEVGGYVGRWALQIAERYHPRLLVFEPQAWAAATCQAVLGTRAWVFPCALGDHDGEVTLANYGTDGATLCDTGGERVLMREACAALTEAQVDTIDLMLINIEGYEYTLIPHLLAHDIRPRALMVQWHIHQRPPDDATDAALLAAGYRCAWTYGPTLEAWVQP